MGSTSADTHRPDLEKAGLSDGRHGFDFDIPEMIPLSERSKIGIRVTGTALYLEPYRSSSSMVQTLSRFGGLWIDQPDWIDTLAGKHRNGQFSDQLCDRLFHFVRDGYVVIRARCQWRYLIA